MKEKIYRNWLKISIGIITFGIILDIGVVSTGVSQFIVTDSYMYKVIGIMQYLDNSNIDHEKTVAGFVKTFAMQALNWFIKNKCCKFESTYDEKGLENLEKFLENKGYSIRNFSFVSDWTLKRYSQTLPYRKLKEIENAITMCRMNGINEHVYAKKDIFKYNIVVSKAKMKNLTDQECLSELERFGRYKEYYYVDGVLLDKRKALESIRRKFYVYEFDFKLYIKFRIVSNDL